VLVPEVVKLIIKNLIIILGKKHATSSLAKQTILTTHDAQLADQVAAREPSLLLAELPSV